MARRRRSGGGSSDDLAARRSLGGGLESHLAAEDLDTRSLETAQTWERAYSELVDFEEKVLKRLQDLLPTLSVAARQEAELTNLPMIVDHLKTFLYRRAHWRKRLAELDAH